MLEKIFMSLCKIHSPPREEHQMIAYIESFLQERIFWNVSFQSDIQWGLYASLPGTKSGSKKDILLMAHLDSTHTTPLSCSSIEYDDQTEKFSFLPEVGLDDKTGLAVILEIVDLYVKKEISVDFDIHILLSTKEEIGQQGLLNAPLKNLFDVQNLRYALCIDRKSNRNAEQKRHIVDEYCSIPLLENDDLLHLLNRVTPSLSLPPLHREISHNCADALELRIRINIEMLFRPQSAEEILLLRKYKRITLLIQDLVRQNKSIGSFRSGLRAERYRIAKQIISHMPDTGVCIANLSMDYEEGRGTFEGQELKNTVLLLQHMFKQHNNISPS